MGRQSIDDDRKAINPSCMWGLMNAVDYHHWRYSVLKRIMFPNKGGNHVKHVKGYQIPKFDYDDEQQQTLLQEEEKKKKKNLAVESVTKKNGSSKKRSIKSRLKSLLANHKTKEAKGKQQQNTKYSSRRRHGLQRTYSIHHLEYPNHDPEEKRSNWDHPIIFIPGKKEVNEEEESSDMKKANENEEFANVLELLKVDKRLYLEIMKNSKDGTRKPSTAKPKAKLVKSGSFPGTRSSSRFKPSKLKDKQSVLKWERFPDSSGENTEGIKLSKALSLILASTPGSNQEEGEEQERRRGVSFDAFSHTRSVSLNESMDKYVGLIENNFKKEEKLPQSRSLRLRNEDDIKPRLITRIGSLSNADLYTSFQYEEENFPEWPVTFSEEMSSYTNEDSKVDDPTYEVDDNLAGFHTESFGDECGFKAEQYNTESTDTCPEKNTSRRTDDNTTDEMQESCLMCVPESIDDFESVQGVENKCDDFDEEYSSFNNKKTTSDAFSLPGNTDHNYQAEIDYIRHILEFSGFNNPNALLHYSSDQQPLKPCLFDEACRPEDLERFTEDLGSFYYYQLLFGLINEELVRLNETLSTYYPKALSYSCRVRVLPPIGNRFVEEVCSDIGKLLDFKPEEIVSLDSIVDYDLKRDEENWMNLQWESESVALEVDHMIFEDLLKELVC